MRLSFAALAAGVCLTAPLGLPAEPTEPPRNRQQTQTAVSGLVGNLLYAPLDVEIAGWRIKGRWTRRDGATPVLEGTAEDRGGADGELSFRLPMMGRDEVTRAALARGKLARFTFAFPQGFTPNPLNCYRVHVSVVSAQSSGSHVFLVKGKDSDRVNLGAPKTSRRISALPFGTCAHFSYGRSGPFQGWRRWRELLAEISACGLKWIRDGVGVKKDAKGNYVVDPYDLDWVREANKLGIGTILCLWMDANTPLDDAIASARAVATQTRGLVRVFELGNEPNNFGGWIPKYGGTWNAKENDNSTSPWLKEYVKVQNTMAEAIHEVRPDAEIVGGTHLAPSNFRALDIGLSPLIRGVGEHPYTNGMPPERDAFGLVCAERDGVAVGDALGTFEGLIASYMRKFQQTGRERRLWNTEFGCTSYWYDGSNHPSLAAGYSERAQAIYLVRRFMQSLALPIAATIQYDFLDDYGSEQHNPEANFGLLRSDFSRKPAFYAIQRMNSLLDGFAPDAGAQITVTDAPLHWSQIDARSEVYKRVMAYGFAHPKEPGRRLLAVWSAQPVSGESNNRAATIRIKGWKAFGRPPVAVNLISGDSFEVPLKRDGDDLVLERLSLGEDPLIVQFFADDYPTAKGG